MLARWLQRLSRLARFAFLLSRANKDTTREIQRLLLARLA